MTAIPANQGWDSSRSAAGAHNPWLITVILSIATFMTVLDTSIANVSLLNIAGSLGTSYDESTWILTSYLVANAVILPISGWLSDVIGRKRFYMLSVGLFTIASLLCGLAPNLTLLVAFRVFQGIGGGGMAPSEQAMLADSFPPARRAQAFAIYGVAVIVAPAVGPAIGGYITDNASWHWIFFINVPVGALSLALVAAFVDEPPAMVRERLSRWRRGLRVDWVGFVLSALALGFLEIVLDKGQEDDWFNSTFIMACALASGLSFLVFVPWELTRDDPIVDISLIGRRQFGTSFFIMLAVGAVLFGTTQLMPQLLQQNFAYTATWAGLSLMPGGFAAMAAMMAAGRVSGFVQPRYMMAAALLAISAALYHFTDLSPDTDFWWFAWARVFQMVGIPLLFLVITSYSYIGLPWGKSGQASALINVARNLGGSIGISAAQTLLARGDQFYQARLDANIFPSSIPYADTFRRASAYFLQHGSSMPKAQRQATAWIGQTLMNQATLLSYIDVFAYLALFALLLVPASFLLQRVDLRSPPRKAASSH
ncbi:MAG TPA: DHA2 family efflux MFS transporter permease subunit [Roseiarcus sp.]|nr:DHA2 family efflux MFS transporter permease subunit [Roseiarcus sp.]